MVWCGGCRKTPPPPLPSLPPRSPRPPLPPACVPPLPPPAAVESPPVSADGSGCRRGAAVSGCGAPFRQPRPRQTFRPTSRQTIRAGCCRPWGTCRNTWRREKVGMGRAGVEGGVRRERGRTGQRVGYRGARRSQVAWPMLVLGVVLERSDGAARVGGVKKVNNVGRKGRGEQSGEDVEGGKNGEEAGRWSQEKRAKS